MWDESVLQYLNERAHERAVNFANTGSWTSAPVAKTTKGVTKPLPVFPLSVLARKLLGGPPSLAYFVELLEQSENFKSFLDLVRNYLPEYEVNIMAEDLDKRALKFVDIFSKKYFPLCDDLSDEFTIGDLLEGIPTQPMGFSYESYHSFRDFREGYILALSLVEPPWEDELDPLDFDEEEEEMPGGRVPILETVSELVGKRQATLIPNNGWPAEYLHQVTDGTEFEGLGAFADWVHSNTGLYHLDALGEASALGEQIEWEPGDVEGLTDDWHQSSEYMEEFHRVALLLEKDSVSTFERLLAMLLDNEKIIIPKEQMNLPLP